MSGLEGVVVAETRLSGVDGLAGVLRIAGSDVGEVAPLGLVAVTERLWDRPVTPEALGAARSALDARLEALWPALAGDGMAALRTGLGLVLPEEADDVAVLSAVGVVGPAGCGLVGGWGRFGRIRPARRRRTGCGWRSTSTTLLGPRPSTPTSPR